MRRSTLIVAFLFGVAGCDRGMSPDLDAVGSPLAVSDPVSPSVSASSGRVPGRFVVTLAARENARDVARAHGVEPDFVYSSVMSGFAGSISEAARSGLLRDARVVRVDPDQLFTSDGGGTQTAAPWGLDRIDQAATTLDGRFVYPGTGAGVTAYIVDGGLYYGHRDFGGRAKSGFDAYGGNGADCRGHGTHVAGTVGGTTFGVAKGVSLVSVRVLDCAGSGTTSTVLAGLDWIAANATMPAVVNMSLGGDPDDVIDAAVRRVIENGVTVVVAAGNRTRDACYFSPSRVVEAITVGASDKDDTKPYFSNFGPCIDLYAPGVSIPSAAISGDTATALMSGTSMAAPHVAGAAALILAANAQATPEQVAATIASQVARYAVIWGSPMGHLLQVPTASAPTQPNSAPVASFGATCSGLACAFQDRSADADGQISAWAWDFGDGSVSSERNPTHSYSSSGSYRVTLRVVDGAGGTASAMRDVAVAAPEAVNQLPSAAFTSSCERLSCSFADDSRDADGRIVRWVWSFGDGSPSSAVTDAVAAHAFPSSGEFTVTLSVTDDQGASSTASRRLAVGVLLKATGMKVKGRTSAELRWTGATSADVAIIVNGATVATVVNSGAFSYRPSGRGQTTSTFQVCETGGTPVCSSAQTLTY